jgi:hypothetical protein
MDQMAGVDLVVASRHHNALGLEAREANHLDQLRHQERLAREAFAPLDPEMAQFEMAVEQYAALLADLKPQFIHHPESKRLIQEMLIDLGCDPQQVYFDVPRMRNSTSNDYLTTGIAFALHPHRDTWHSAPFCQLNWWLPIFPISEDNGLAFHPRLFSGAQLHSSVPNTSGRTRFSIDLRTVHIGRPSCGAEHRLGVDRHHHGRLPAGQRSGAMPSELIAAYDIPKPATV